MKVVLVNSLYAPHFVGGAELSVQILAETLVRRGHTVHVVCLAPERGTDEINGVRVSYLPLRNLYWPFGNRRGVFSRLAWHGRDVVNPGMAEDVGRVIDQVKPDVVHTNNVTGFSVAVLGAVRVRGIRLVHTLRDYYLLCLRSAMCKGDRICGSRCLECFCVSSVRQWAAAPVDFVAGISAHILNVHRRAGWFQSVPGGVIHNPFVAPRETNRKIPGKTVRFGYMGRLTRNKGLEPLLTAFEQVRRSHSAELLIAGDGAPEDAARYRAMAGVGVSFLGYTRPDGFFPRIDVLVVPSLWNEPLGRVVIEAFSYGVPVIASNRGGLPELVTGGENGFLFNPDNDGELRALMTGICNDPQSAARLSDAARAAARFSPDNIASAYESAYSASTGR